MIETYEVEGVAVTKYSPNTQTNKAPVLMVHGGNHAAWCWQNWATFFQKAGYEVHALDWYNHGASQKLPEEVFIKRSIVDVARQEITHVVDKLEQSPILIGHSMGGLASAVFAAEDGRVSQLVLVAPVMPTAAHAAAIPLPVDLTKPFPPLPYEQTKQLFFTRLNDEDARRYYELLTPESPQAVYEAVNWSVEFDLAKITARTFVMADELDGLIPGEALSRYAQLLNANYQQIDGIGHCDLLLKAPEWQTATGSVKKWLEIEQTD